MIVQGTTFWGSYPNDPNGKHLWFVLSDPSLTNGNVLIANATSRRYSSDLSCILTPTDHPRIEHESVINYRKATVVPGSSITKAANAQPDWIVFVEDSSSELVMKILEGATKSSAIIQEALEAARFDLSKRV